LRRERKREEFDLTKHVSPMSVSGANELVEIIPNQIQIF